MVLRLVLALFGVAAIAAAFAAVARRVGGPLFGDPAAAGSLGAAARKGKDAFARSGRTAQDLVLAADIRGPALIQKDGTAVCYLKIECKNNSLLSPAELAGEAEAMATAISSIDRPFKMVHIQRPVDSSANLARLEQRRSALLRKAAEASSSKAEKRQKLQDRVRIEVMSAQIRVAELEVKRAERMRSEVYFCLPATPSQGNEGVAYQAARDLQDALKASGYDARVLFGEEIVSFLLAYDGAYRAASERTDPDAPGPFVDGVGKLQGDASAASAAPQSIGARSAAQDRGGAVEPNPNVADLLAPSVFDDGRNPKAVLVGQNLRSVLYVRDYASMLPINWGEVLFGKRGSVTTFLCRPSDPKKLARAIDHSDARQGVTLASGSSASSMEEAERAREHGRSMLRIMGDTHERFFDTVVFQTVSTDGDEADLRSSVNNLISLAAGKHLTLEYCVEEQERAYFAAGPYWAQQEWVWSRYGRDVCASTIGASLPCQDNSLDDGVGTTLGWCEPDRSVCRLNTTETSDERPNCNIWISGASSQGKTYAASKILLSEWAQGARVVIIDPDRQFDSFCKKAKGQWVNAGGGIKRRKGGVSSGACFSPLQPRLGNFDFDEGVESAEEAYRSDTQEVLRATLTFLHGWAELAWSTHPDDTALLDHGLVAAYARYGIGFDTTAADLREGRYPVMEDLKECFEDLARDAEFEADAEAYRRFARKAEQCCEGGVYGNLWAGRTNVDVTSDLVVFDVYELMEGEEHIRTAQLFSILSWVWSQACISRATGTFLRVFLDEGHLFYGGGTSKVSATAASCTNMIQKRIRKYNGGLAFATQQIGDVLDPAVRRYGESLIVSSVYKVLFHTEATDLGLLREAVASLTDTVAARMAGKYRRGDCLVCAGNARAEVHVEQVGFEEEFFMLERGAE